MALAVGILANGLTKLILALAVGRGRFRLLTGAGLTVMTLAGLAALAASH